MRAALIVIAAFALASCGGSGAGSTSSSSSAAHSTSSARSAPSAPPTSTSGPATTASGPATSSGPATTGAASSGSATHASSATTSRPTTAAGPVQCGAAGLALSFLGGQGATGHGELGFALRNTSGHSCTTIGYPGILFLDQAGAPLLTIPTHTTHDFFGSTAVSALTVAPGQTVSFRLGVTHGIASPAGCTTAYGLQVIPPNDTATLRTTIPGGAYECRTASVSPVRPGLSAFP
jgi:Domain of unknown function (DUF4232)